MTLGLAGVLAGVLTAGCGVQTDEHEHENETEAPLQTGTQRDALTVATLGNVQLDATFDGDGRVTAAMPGHANNDSDKAGNAVLVDAWDRIIVGGSSGGKLQVGRFRPDGSVDASFGDDGFTTTDTPTWLGSVTIADLAFVDGGARFIAAGHGDGRFILARYWFNGALDTSFGTDGIAFRTENLESWTNVSLVVDPAGGLALGGTAKASDGRRVWKIVRFLPDGTRDSNFGTQVLAMPDNSKRLPRDGIMTDLVGMGDLYVAVGYTTKLYNQEPDERRAVALARWHRSGVLDTALGVNGVVIHGPPLDWHDVWAGGAAVHNNEIVVAGFSINDYGEHVALLTKYNGDLSHNAFTWMDFVFEGPIDEEDFHSMWMSSVRVDSEERIVSGGRIITLSEKGKFMLTRHDWNLVRDFEFGDRGLIMTKFDDVGVYQEVRGLGVDTQGRVVAAGSGSYSSGERIAVARYTDYEEPKFKQPDPLPDPEEPREWLKMMAKAAESSSEPKPPAEPPRRRQSKSSPALLKR